MTQKVNPSPIRPAEAFKTAGSIAYGASSDGFVINASSPTDLSVQDTGIDETALNAFDASHTTSSLDVTIDGGEAFVFGSWLAKDTTTTVSLTASTADQMVYVGWNKNGTNDVIIGTESAFATAADDTDEKIPLWSFDTDGTGVTSAENYRAIGQSLSVNELSILRSIEADRIVRIDADYGMNISGPFTVNGRLHTDGSTTVTNGPIYGGGSITGTGSVSVLNDSGERIEPIEPTIDNNIFVAIAGWTTDNDDGSYDAYRFGEAAGISIAKDEQLTIQ